MKKFALAVVFLCVSGCATSHDVPGPSETSDEAAKAGKLTKDSKQDKKADPVQAYDPEPVEPTDQPDAGKVAEPPTVEPYDPEPSAPQSPAPEQKQPEHPTPALVAPPPAAEPLPVEPEPAAPPPSNVEAPAQPEPLPVEPIASEPAPVEPVAAVCEPDECEDPYQKCTPPQVGAANTGGSDSGSWSHSMTLHDVSDKDFVVLPFMMRKSQVIRGHIESDLRWSDAYYVCTYSAGFGKESCGAGTAWQPQGFGRTTAACMIIDSDFEVRCNGTGNPGALHLNFNQPLVDGELPKTATRCEYMVSVTWQ